MRYLEFFILFLKLLELSHAASNDRDNRVENISISERCRTVFGTPCSLPEESRNDEPNCTCVPYYLCTGKNGTLITDGSAPGLINLRFGKEEQPIITRTLSECASWMEYCCHRPRNSDMDGNGDTGGNTDMGGNGDMGGNDTGSSMPTPISRGCGYRNSDGIIMRITDTDNEAQFGEFPWMVAVLQYVRSELFTGVTKPEFKCGGALIHPRAVLTSAHNVQSFLTNPSDLTVRAGEWDISSESEVISHQERQVETIILHENYNQYNARNDFAILILSTAFDIVQNVNTICLPEETGVFDAAKCIVTGWGKDKFERDNKLHTILKRIKLPIVRNDLCQTFLRSTRLGQFFELHQSFICAGGEDNRDACEGDGGGPLVCPLQNAPDRYVQAGIVSWGIGCAEPNIPGIYARVSYARQWIDSKLALYNLNKSSYIA